MEKLSHFKCAYCECLINARRSEHVEHFKPKSLFPSLAYDWDNYFLACDGCNGTKLDKWPEKGEYVRPDKGTQKKLFEFAEDGSIKAADDDTDAQQTITDFGLDRDGLQRERRIMIKMQLDDVRGLIAAGVAPDLAAELVRKKLGLLESPETPCSVALSQNVRRAWHAAYPGIDL